MIHMHYLRSSTQQGKKCIPISEVAENAPDFVKEMWAEWNSKKRVQKVIATPKRALSDGTHLPLSIKRHRTADIRDLVQKQVVTCETVQAAWDSVFFKSVLFNLADDADIFQARCT